MLHGIKFALINTCENEVLGSQVREFVISCAVKPFLLITPHHKHDQMFEWNFSDFIANIGYGVEYEISWHIIASSFYTRLGVISGFILTFPPRCILSCELTKLYFMFFFLFENHFMNCCRLWRILYPFQFLMALPNLVRLYAMYHCLGNGCHADHL